MGEAQPAAVACTNHPGRTAARRCVRCSRVFCGACAVPTLNHPPEEGHGACGECRRKVPAWVWNRFGGGIDEDPGAHLLQALRLSRPAWLRAGWGEVPPAALVVVVWLGCLGATWIGIELVAWWSPDPAPAAARVGYGLPWSLVVLGAMAAFAGVLHALQPAGKAPASTIRQSMQIVATGFVSPSILWGCAGLSALIGGVGLGAQWVLWLSSMALPIGLLWGCLAAGWGIAIRRGAGTPVGLMAAVGAMAVTGVILGLVVFVGLNPPWGSAWG